MSDSDMTGHQPEPGYRFAGFGDFTGILAGEADSDEPPTVDDDTVTDGQASTVDPWLVSPTTGEVTSAAALVAADKKLAEAVDTLSTTVDEHDERLSALEAEYTQPGQIYERWLDETLGGVYYFTPDQVQTIRGNTALTAEFRALHMWWGVSFADRQHSARAQADWHTGFAQVRARIDEWNDRKRDWTRDDQIGTRTPPPDQENHDE